MYDLNIASNQMKSVHVIAKILDIMAYKPDRKNMMVDNRYTYISLRYLKI